MEQELSWATLKTNLYSLLYQKPSKSTLDILEWFLEQNIDTFSSDDLLFIFGTFLGSYNRLFNRKIRILFTKSILSIIHSDPVKYVAKFKSFVKPFADPNRLVAVYDLKVLLSWIIALITDEKLDDLTDFVIIQFEISSKIYYQRISVKQKHLESLQHVFRDNKKSIRSWLSSETLQSLTSEKFSVPAYLLYISTVFSIDDTNDQGVPDLMSAIQYFNNSVLLTKDKALGSQLGGISYFNEFVISKLTHEQFCKELLPILEKSILRSNEYVCTYILPKLTTKFADELVLKSDNEKEFTKFFTSLLSNLKSSVENVRLGSMKALEKLLPTAPSTEQIASELIKLLKSTSNVEYKLLYIKAMSLLPVNIAVSGQLLDLVAPLVSKEQNEHLLPEYLKIFFNCLFCKGDGHEKTVFNGFKEKKFALRRYWYLQFVTAFLKLPSNEIPQIVETLVKDPSFIPENASDAKLPPIVLYGVALVCLKMKIEVPFDTELLFKSRTFLKLSLEDEFEVFSSAIIELIDSQRKVEDVNELELTLVYIFFTSQYINGPKDAVLKLGKLTDDMKVEVAGWLINGLTKTIQNSHTEEIEKLGLVYTRFSKVFNELLQGNKSEKLDIVLSRTLVLCHSDPIKLKSGWVGLVQNCRLDPGKIVEEFGAELFKDYSSEILDSNSTLQNAYIQALSEMAFIQPDILGPLIEATVSLDVPQFKQLEADWISIWQLPEGELLHDPLDNASQKNQKGGRQNETEKWEEELKKELAKKKGKTQQKLSKAEQELVNAQKQKEADIRAKVEDIRNHLLRSMRLVPALCIEVDTGRKYWFSRFFGEVLECCKSTLAQTLLGEELNKAFLAGSGSKESLGTAILMFFGILELKKDLLLSELNSAAFSTLNKYQFIYMLPLLTEILQKHSKMIFEQAGSLVPKQKSEFVNTPFEEEVLTLTIEIVNRNSELFQDETVPKSLILGGLLEAIKVPTMSQIVKEVFNGVCANASETISDSELAGLVAQLINKNATVRKAILEQLDQEFLLDELEPTDYVAIYVCCFDNEPEISELANSVWQENELVLIEESISELVNILGFPDHSLRLSVARAIAQGARDLNKVPEVCTQLLDLLEETAKPPAPVYDEYGLLVKTHNEKSDFWETRSGIALCFKELAGDMNTETVSQIFSKLLDGPKLLDDTNGEVRSQLEIMAVEILNCHGSALVQVLGPMFEKALVEKTNTLTLKQSCVIVYSALGRHLSSNDSKLYDIVDQLIAALNTPSEKVQFTVSKHISPLVPLVKGKSPDYLSKLMEQLFNGKSRASRRGAAWGIAGLVKGAGIESLAKFDIIRDLLEASEDKSNSGKREAASFAFECLSRSLGPFFEPYVIEIIPNVLQNLGDHSADVRAATEQATKTIMGKTTPFGVKKLIPLAIENLDDNSWRSKKGSVELLGSMAYLDPVQLSASLPHIVPEIVGVLNDTHKEVRKAGDQALKRFGEVIRNPEIQKSVPILIRAIGDPTKHTEEALDALINTQFVHYIDGPSLALIIHVIHRGMLDRSAMTKRKACQIVGNMSFLVDSRDLIPYLGTLVSELETAMVDPVPTTRATAARALGSLVEKLGEKQFPTLIDKLLATLADPMKEGDRLGAAQALAEVLSGLGVSRLEEVLPEVLSGAQSPRAYVRAGFMPLLLYLPVCFGSLFSPFIAKILPPILAGLADEDDSVNETAIRAAKLIVEKYSTKAVALLLPELETGMSNANFKIRLSSVRLTGDLLFNIAQISPKLPDLVDGEEPVDAVAETMYLNENPQVASKLMETLGEDRYARVFSLLFICRSDISGQVRNAAVEVWAPLVSHTPRTLKQILPTLAGFIIKRLASPDETMRRISAAALGDLVRRVGPSVLNQLLPTSQQILATGDSDAKQGICIALSEIIQSTVESNIVSHQGMFVKIIGDALIDSDDTVRYAAANAFDSLFEAIGEPAIDGVIPRLLSLLDSSNEQESENAIKALTEVLHQKSEEIFPILVPSLLSDPFDLSKANAFGQLAGVVGDVLQRYLGEIIERFVSKLATIYGAPDFESFTDAFKTLLVSVKEQSGVHPLMQKLMSLLKSESQVKSEIVLMSLATFFKETHLNYQIYCEDILHKCILFLNDSNDAIVENAWQSLNSLVSNQPKEYLDTLIEPALQALQSLTQKLDARAVIKGFTINKGPGCVLPVFIHGLMHGTSLQKEHSANAIELLVLHTPAANLKPFFTTITGPLIRVIGEKVSGDIKVAILSALIALLESIPQFLRPFIPQLQRTFIKALSDPSSQSLRMSAAKALGTLIKYQPRVDPVVTELVNLTKASEDEKANEPPLAALSEVINAVGPKISESSKKLILELIESKMSSESVAYASIVGSVAKIVSEKEGEKIVKEKILDYGLTKFSVLVINAFLKDAPQHIFGNFTEQVVSLLIEGIEIDESSAANDMEIVEQSIIAAGKLLLQKDFEVSEEQSGQLITALSKKMVKGSVDCRRLSLVVIRTVARHKYELSIEPNLDIVAPSVFSCVRDVIIPVKLVAEKAYLALFQLVDFPERNKFETWFAKISDGGKTTITNAVGGVIQLRSIGDYTKRVSMRLAKVEKERIEAGGDPETVFSDQFEDEREIWKVGK